MAENLNTPPQDLVRLSDPLADVTRKERRSLLGVSMLGIAIALAELVPTEVAGLGVKLSQSNQSTLMVLVGLVCLYYLFAFCIYAASDFVAWQMALREAYSKAALQPPTPEPETEQERAQEERMAHRYMWLEDFLDKKFPSMLLAGLAVEPISKVRAIFDFLLPVCVGLVAVIALLWRGLG